MSKREKTVRTIIDNEAVSLWFHPGTKIVHHEIHRFIYGPQFRELLEKGLEVFVAEGARKWLSDDRRNGPLNAADGTWAETVWGPRVTAAGWTHWGIVLPQKILGEMNMRVWIDLYKSRGVTVQAFADPDKALMWLEAQ